MESHEEKSVEIMKDQGYRFIGNSSAVKICLWTKKSIRNEGVCYKEKFYGIRSHRCCQITPWLGCDNNCIHCWRALELNFNKLIINNKIDSPKEIIEGCIKAQRKLLEGFKILPKTKEITLSKANMKKWEEAQEPMQFAISLSGEPTIYPHIAELILELRKRGKTSFLVTNGLHPEKLKELIKKNALPTQLYISVNAPNKELYNKIHRSSKANAWELLNESLKLMSKIKTRTVFRINLIRDLNMSEKNVLEYAERIKKYKPLFVEIKGYMSVGFARERLGYEKMPTEQEVKEFSERLAKQTKLKILDSHEYSRAWVLGKKKEELKIRNV